MHKINQKRTVALLKPVALGATLLMMAGCVVEPYPPAGPPVAPVAAGPAPYYGCCSYYPDYPPYPYYGYGPAYGVGVGFYDGGRYGGWHRWR